MKAVSLFFAALILISGFNSHAEYRVFELQITDTKTQASRSITSTLDPIQYPRYYPVQASEVVSYTQTWRCRGRTDYFLPYCPNPKAQSPAPPANP